MYTFPVTCGVSSLIECKLMPLPFTNKQGLLYAQNARFMSTLRGASLPFKDLCEFRMDE